MKTPPLGCAVLLALVIPAALLALFAQTPPPAPSPSPKESPPASADYDLRWGVKIPMRDKVELNTTLYLPKTKDGTLSRTPAIFTLTPYISDSYHARAAYFASHGYAFALVDVRGRGNSSGEFEPFAQEPHDGHDVVEWLAQRPASAMVRLDAQEWREAGFSKKSGCLLFARSWKHRNEWRMEIRR
jgi:uncharacterized protein